MLSLIDILKVQGIELGRYKIHLATKGKGISPMDAYWEGTFKEWQEDQNAKNFECDTVVSLIHRSEDQWLFAGVYRILGVESTNPKFKYKTELLPGKGDLVGRIIVKYKCQFRNSYIRGEKFGSELAIAKFQEVPFAIEDFKGFNKVLIPYGKLKLITQVESWRSALSSVGGVYLVMDSKTFKGYVGIAYGEGGILRRWGKYAETGHGGNVGLVELIELEGIAYAEHFQFAILEIADLLDTLDQVQKRETHWKDVLMTRKSQFGYNLN